MRYGEILARGSVTPDTETFYGWPTMIRRHNGEILLTASARLDHLCPFGRIVLFRSGDGGRSWSEPQTVADGPLDDRDPSIVELPDGSLRLAWTAGLEWLRYWDERCNCTPEQTREAVAARTTLAQVLDGWGTWMAASEDGGAHWSDAWRIPIYSEYGAAVLPDGTMVAVGEENFADVADMRCGSWLKAPACARSGDGGRNWQITSRFDIGAGSKLRLSESMAARMRDGRLVAVFRNDGPGGRDLWQMVSYDAGDSWSEPRRICDGLPPHLLTLPDGGLLLSYARRDYCGGMSSVCARFSDDYGDSWSEPWVVAEDAPSPDMGYPSTVLLDDGAFLTVWYNNCRRVEASGHWNNKVPFLQYAVWRR